MEELISVIIPVYNTQKYLRQCVDSVIRQTYPRIEILLVDDGSEDSSGLLCDELAGQDDRIRVFHKANGGLSSARNFGLNVAKGQWISFIDSDDFVHVDFLKSMIENALRYQSQIVVCGLQKRNTNGKLLEEYCPEKQVVEWISLHRYFLREGKGREYMCNKLFHASLFQKIRFPEGKYYEDVFVLTELLELSHKAVFISETGYYYNFNPESISNNTNIDRQMDGLEAKQKKLDFMLDKYPVLASAARQEVLEACCWLLYKLYKQRGTNFYQYKQQILSVFYKEKKNATVDATLLKIAIALISISPWLFYRCYSIYDLWKMRLRQVIQPKKRDTLPITFFSGDITRSGGTERVGTIIAEELYKLNKYEISIVSLTESHDQPFYNINKEIKRAYFSKKWIQPGAGYLMVLVKLIRYIRKNQVKIIIDIDGVLDVLSIPAKLFTGVKVVSWEHFNYYQDLGSFYRSFIRRLAAIYADCIVTLTLEDKNFYQSNLKIHHDIRVIRNPVGYLKENKKSFCQKNRKRILSAGNLTRQKGFDYIPVIGTLLTRYYPALDWEWHIVGEGEDREKLQLKIQEAGLENRIILAGKSKDIRRDLEEADIYVMTSRYEGLPMILLEAKMYHLPIVSFDIHSGPNEIIQNGLNGYLICPPQTKKSTAFLEMAEKIAVLCTNDALYQQFSEHSMEQMEAFQINYVIENWCDLLDHLCP